MKKGIVLCSGGLDSVAAAFVARKKLKYRDIIILFFNYGQLSLNQERKASRFCAKSINSEFVEVKIPELKKLALAPLVQKRAMPKETSLKNTKAESKHWYLPWRNLVFLSYAMSYAEAQYIKNAQVCDIIVGFKSEGNEPYPDASSKFITSFNRLIKKNSEMKTIIHAPFIKKDKEDIILIGKELKIDLEKTYSCYIGKRVHCGNCLACRLRKAGFYWAGIEDRTKYR